MPMSRSPMISAIKVSHTGFRIRSPMILLFRKYSSLWITTRNTNAKIASFRETVKETKTMIVLLTKLPTIGTRPHRKVTAMSNGACGIPIAMRKIAVNPVLTNDIVICAPITVAKLR
jgi:hypothetical protein